MKKTLSIFAFSIMLLIGTTLEAEAQNRGRSSRGGSVSPSQPRTAPQVRRTTPTRTRRTAPAVTRRTRNPRTTSGYNTSRNSRVDRRTRNPRTTSGYNTRTPRRTSTPAYRNNHPVRRTVTTYRRYNHAPYRHTYTPSRRFVRTANYGRYIRQNYANYFYRNWILYPSARANGYYVHNNYPYFVFNGYMHRYSNQDICDYQLVDSYTDSVVRYFDNRTCSYGYDECARERDVQNSYSYSNRYFCAENYQYSY